MGRFSTVGLLLLAACGDNGDVDVLDGAPVDELVTDGTSGNGVAMPRYVPQVCGSQTWTTNINGDAMNVSVAMNGQKAVMLAAPQKGGTLAGLVVDPATHTMTTNKVEIAGTFTQVTATVISNRVAATSVADSTILLHTLDDDLTNAQYVTKLPGRHLAEPALFWAGDELVMPVGGDDGVWLHRYADSFEPLGSTHLLDTDPVVSLTSAMSGNNMVTAWTTQHDCWLMSTNMISANMSARIPAACNEPRLAVGTAGQAVMVFETTAGASLLTFNATGFTGSARMLRSGTEAPRTVFDGTNFWVSFLDERGDVIVGILDANNHLTSMSLAGPRPRAGSYELVMGDGSPWVVSLAEGEYTAHRMCVGVL